MDHRTDSLSPSDDTQYLIACWAILSLPVAGMGALLLISHHQHWLRGVIACVVMLVVLAVVAVSAWWECRETPPEMDIERIEPAHEPEPARAVTR